MPVVALSLQQRDALLAAQQSVLATVRTRLTDYAVSLWGSLGSWRDADIDRFVDTIVPKVLAGQRTIANLTDNYLAQVTDTKTAGAINVENIRGVPDQKVYRRPAVTLYRELSKGKKLDDAQKSATSRLGSLVATGLQMAHVRQAQYSLQGNGGVEAFRRVLQGPGDCALCILASTQRYWKGDLLPIHPGCNCTVDSLGVGDHFDQVLDQDQLARVHSQVEGFAGSSDTGGRTPDYRKMIVVRDHGEIGPLLTWKHQQFTVPTDIG